MAAIRIEDEAHTDPRFVILGKKIKSTRFDALGRMAAIWAYCTQKHTYYLAAEVIDVIAECDGFAKLIVLDEIGLAEITEKGIRIKGTKGRIEWLKKLRDNGKKGGRPKKTKTKPDGNQEVTKVEPPSNPIAPVPVPVPAPVKKTEREEIRKCVEAWGITLSRFKIDLDPKLDELNIAKLIASNGFEKTELALLGMGFEEKTKDYDPGKHVGVYRLLKPSTFEKFVKLGAQNRPAKREIVEVEVKC